MLDPGTTIRHGQQIGSSPSLMHSSASFLDNPTLGEPSSSYQGFLCKLGGIPPWMIWRRSRCEIQYAEQNLDVMVF
jgi:hypothetical protein